MRRDLAALAVLIAGAVGVYLYTRGLPEQGEPLRVDHVTLCVAALDPWSAMFTAAGIVNEYGGKHANGISEMALTAFPDGSYLELIAPQPGVDASPHYWGDFMTRQAGPCGWAVTSTNIEADTKRLAAAGIAIERAKGGRKRPDGVELRWQTATVGPAPQGSYFPFLIFDETDRNLRAYPQGHPTMTDISGVRYVVVGVRDLKRAVEQYRAAFGLPEPSYQDDLLLGAHLAGFANTPIVLAAPAGEETWLGRRLEEFGEIPCAFILGSDKDWDGVEEEWFGGKVTWLELGGMRVGVVGGG